MDEKTYFVMCHYCMSVWPASHYGSWLLYGHSHGRIPEYEDSLKMDVGVDVWEFTPIKIDSILKYYHKIINLKKEKRGIPKSI